MASRIDYSNIANRYDKNPVRSLIKPDQTLEFALGKPWTVLDLGCGTGSFIESQTTDAKNKNILWHGLDPSEEMLRIARNKVPFAEFHTGVAENMPFANSHFDYVTSRFSFHHLDDRLMALKEIHRILKPGGFLKIVNLVPELSPNWWIFRYFPTARMIDAKRFWTIDHVVSTARDFGFCLNSTQLEMKEQIKAKLVLDEARNRETSELLLIDEDEYKNGLKTLETELTTLGDRLVTWGLMIAELEFKKT